MAARQIENSPDRRAPNKFICSADAHETAFANAEIMFRARDPHLIIGVDRFDYLHNTPL